VLPFNPFTQMFIIKVPSHLTKKRKGYKIDLFPIFILF